MKYDYIIVLCSEKKDKNGKFPEFLDGKYLGGQTRMNAAVEMYKENKEAEFIIVGGYDENGEGSKKVEDMYEFLTNECQNIKIFKCPSLPCTFHNLVAIFNTWRKHNIKLENKKIGLLTNFYHLPRALRFWSELNRKEEFKNIFIPCPIPISAESVVQNISSEMYNERSGEYLSTLMSEAEGFKDIEKDSYTDNCLLKKREFFIEIAKKYPNILLTSEERKAFGF